MRTLKTLTFFIAAFAAVLISLSAASALSFGTVTSDHPNNRLTVNSDVEVTLTNDGTNATTENVVLTLDNVDSFVNPSDVTMMVERTTGNDIEMTGTSLTIPSMAVDESVTVRVSVSAIKQNVDVLQSSNAELIATGQTSNDEDSVGITHFQSFCRNGPKSPREGNQFILEINKVDIENQGDSDGDDDEWFPFDDIEVEVEVENNGDEDNSSHDIDDVTIEIGLFDSNGLNVIDEFEFENRDEEEEDVGGLDPDDEDEAIFRFRLEESDEDLEGSFHFVVKAYEEGNEDDICVDFSDDLESNSGFSEDIDLEREDDEESFIRFNDIVVTPAQATCGEAVRIDADIVNIGDDDVENLEAFLENSALGISISERLGNDLDQGEESSVTFNFNVPSNAANGNYNLILDSEYEVDDDPVDGIEDTFAQLTVLGCPDDIGGDVEDVAITASLVSGGAAGDDLIVETSITNVGNQAGTFTVTAAGFSSWASLDSVSPGTLSLATGETRTSTITLNVNEDTEGRQAFTIDVRNANTGVLVDQREVEVNIGEDIDGDGLPGFADRTNLVWVIAIVNIILIVLIILVAIRLSRRQ